MSTRLPPILLAATLLAPPGAALAQEGTGARISPERPRPAAPRLPEASRATPAEGIDDPATLLRMAQSTLASGRLNETGELLERAEARLLTRSELASRADRPEMGGAIGALAAARAALGRRDRPEAEGRLAAALAALEGASATGAPAMPPVPSLGGGSPAMVPVLPGPITPAPMTDRMVEPPRLPPPTPILPAPAPKPPGM
jgi:hypothetical protein